MFPFALLNEVGELCGEQLSRHFANGLVGAFGIVAPNGMLCPRRAAVRTCR